MSAIDLKGLSHSLWERVLPAVSCRPAPLGSLHRPAWEFLQGTLALPKTGGEQHVSQTGDGIKCLLK